MDEVDFQAELCGAGKLTTLIEDGSNMCWSSGPAGMSDGVMTPRKKTLEIKVLSAIGSGNFPGNTEWTVCRDMCKGHSLRKKRRLPQIRLCLMNLSD